MFGAVMEEFDDVSRYLEPRLFIHCMRIDFFRVWPWPGRGRVAVAVWPWPWPVAG